MSMMQVDNDNLFNPEYTYMDIILKLSAEQCLL